jgi:hypothetical protein
MNVPNILSHLLLFIIDEILHQFNIVFGRFFCSFLQSVITTPTTITTLPWGVWVYLWHPSTAIPRDFCRPTLVPQGDWILSPYADLSQPPSLPPSSADMPPGTSKMPQGFDSCFGRLVGRSVDLRRMPPGTHKCATGLMLSENGHFWLFAFPPSLGRSSRKSRRPHLKEVEGENRTRVLHVLHLSR